MPAAPEKVDCVSAEALEVRAPPEHSLAPKPPPEGVDDAGSQVTGPQRGPVAGEHCREGGDRDHQGRTPMIAAVTSTGESPPPVTESSATAITG